MSEAKMFRGQCFLARFNSSRISIAGEYGSSPVAQPGVQTFAILP